MSFHLIICSDSVVAGLDTLKPSLHLNTSSFTSSQVWSFVWTSVVIYRRGTPSSSHRRHTRRAWRRGSSSRTPAPLGYSPLAQLSTCFCLPRVPSLVPASSFTSPKQNHCSRCCCLDFVFCVFIFVFLASPEVTWRCRLNTLQGEPQKLKISLNVSEDYPDRIMSCDRWIIWKWFCAHMERMASLHRSHLFVSFSENKVLFESANAFAACLIFHLVPPPSSSSSFFLPLLPLSIALSLFPPFGL